MKLKHILILLSALLFSSCGDIVMMVYYTYGNATDKTITVNSYMPKKSESDQAISYVLIDQLIIEPGKEVSLVTGGFRGNVSPFSFGYHEGQYLTVSNGEKIFTQKSENVRGTLYSNRIYTKKIKNDKIYYKYVFTDQDFVDAEPVE